MHYGYMVTSVGRSGLTVNTIRLFDTESAAQKYHAKLSKVDHKVRAYRISDKKEPVFLKWATRKPEPVCNACVGTGVCSDLCRCGSHFGGSCTCSWAECSVCKGTGKHKKGTKL